MVSKTRSKGLYGTVSTRIYCAVCVIRNDMKRKGTTAKSLGTLGINCHFFLLLKTITQKSLNYWKLADRDC